MTPVLYRQVRPGITGRRLIADDLIGTGDSAPPEIALLTGAHSQ